MTFTRVLLAFVAGFLAVLAFHQGALTLLHIRGLAPRAPFPTAATQPFGVPQIWSLAFWGGVWGIVLVAIIYRMQKGTYWLTALLVGAIGPSLVAWFVVLPLKGQLIGGGWQPTGIATALIVNGAWGIGTAFLFHLLGARYEPAGGATRRMS